MALRQVRDARRERADEVLDAFHRLPGSRRTVQERFKRHAHDGRRAAAEAPGRSAERPPQRGRQTDRNLIVHNRPQNK